MESCKMLISSYHIRKIHANISQRLEIHSKLLSVFPLASWACFVASLFFFLYFSFFFFLIRGANPVFTIYIQQYTLLLSSRSYMETLNTTKNKIKNKKVVITEPVNASKQYVVLGIHISSIHMHTHISFEQTLAIALI